MSFVADDDHEIADDEDLQAIVAQVSRSQCRRSAQASADPAPRSFDPLATRFADHLAVAGVPQERLFAGLR